LVRDSHVEFGRERELGVLKAAPMKMSAMVAMIRYRTVRVADREGWLSCIRALILAERDINGVE
jgi:hypothetical protein